MQPYILDLRNIRRQHASFPPGLGAFVALLAAPAAQAQLQLSVLSGRVLGPDGAPMRDAEVALTDALGTAIVAP